MLPLEFVIELFAYLILLVGIYWFSGIHHHMKKLKRPVLIFFVLFFYLLIVGQVNKSSHQTYPFISWTMYSQRVPSPAFMEHIIHLKDGTRKHYPYEYVTFTSPRAFMRKVENIEAKAQGGNSKLLNSTIQSLIEIYERKNPGDKIHSFTLTRNTIWIPEDGYGYEISTTEQFRYKVK